MKVVVVGCWHLGSVVGACIAKAGHEVYFWDQSPRVAEHWKSGQPPIHEPGLNELTKDLWQKKLFWADDLKSVSQSADWIVLGYDTPINDQDEVQLEVVNEGFNSILKSGISNNARFFFTSQLPVGTSSKYRKEILKTHPQWKGFVTYQPENLRLGEAIKSFETPDRMVLGVDGDDAGYREKVVAEFRNLTRNSNTPINVMSLASSEMVKHALNSFLATCVVFANELSELCESTEADCWDVVASLKQDSRVGPKAFLRPGLGFSGGTLARDVKTLSARTQKTESLNFYNHLYKINSHRNDWVKKILSEKHPNLKDLKVTLLGVTYKPFTSTVRRSPALEMGQLLKDFGIKCSALDPMADVGELTDTEKKNLPFQLDSSWEEAFKGSSAAILVTEWPQFLELDWKKIGNLMKDTLVIDCKNHLTKVLGSEFEVRVPGKPLPKRG